MSVNQLNITNACAKIYFPLVKKIIHQLFLFQSVYVYYLQQLKGQIFH